MKYSISVGTVNLILSFLEEKGINTQDFIQTLSLPETIFADPDGRIPTATMQRLWKNAIEETGIAQLPLEFGARINPYGLGIISYLLMNCNTLKVALEKLSLYQDVACAGIKTHLEIQSSQCQLRLDIVDDDITEPSYAVNSEMSVYIKMFEALIRARLPLLQVQFSYDRPADIATHMQIFGTDVLIFNAKYSGFTFPATYLGATIPHANPALFPLFEKHLGEHLQKLQQSESMSYKVRQEVLRLLKGEEPKLTVVARALGVGERSIQLRLNEEGTTFRALLEEVRKDLAMAHLRDNKLSTTDISFLLGFSESSVFSRSFKKWTGQSPNAFRKAFA